MIYEINSKKIFKLIGLPNEIIEYIDELDETTLKTLILIFSENRVLSKFEISKKLKKTILEIDLALTHLEEKKIIKLSTNFQTSIPYVSKPSAFHITATEMEHNIKKDTSIKMLYNEAEKIYARPLNFIEKRTLNYVYQTFNLKIDTILMALDFGVRNNKSIKQIEKICENWSDSGILTHEQAENQIRVLTEQKNIENQIKKCFGIYGRSLSINEKNLISKWTKNYKFDIYMIEEAFNRCVDTIGKLSFQYIEKIIYNWYKSNIKTKQDLKKLELKLSSLKEKKSNINSYNVEKMLKNSDILIKEGLKHIRKI